MVTALDWGLGHATRCIPVIRALQGEGCEVLLCGSGDSLLLLRKEFAGLPFFGLPGYAPRYPRKGGSMTLSMMLQLPRFISVIKSEHHAVEKIVATENIDLVVSDNRYGCWSENAHSIFITHQSNILMPKRFGFMKGLVRRMTTTLINRFDECWIPDAPATESLAGDLAHFANLDVKVPVHHMGPLSRFAYRQSKVHHIDVLAIFSGPEPQRTALEQLVLPQLKSSNCNFRVVRGLPALQTHPDDDRIVNFLAADELQASIESAALIIARSGYSTIMDMKALGKKVIFIPTPGQTEQEYLALRLKNAGVAYSISQDKFDLEQALKKSKRYSGFVPGVANELLVTLVRQVINKISMSPDDERSEV